MTQEKLNSWDGFTGSTFLNTEDVRDENHEFVCVEVELDTENDRPILVLESGELKTKFSLNVTNTNFVKNAGVSSPKACIGKKLTFKKVMAYSPKAKKEVDSLRIKSIQ